MSCPIEARLVELGLELPPSAPSRALFLPGKITGNLLFLSGQICEWEGVPKYFGPVGPGFDTAIGQEAEDATIRTGEDEARMGGEQRFVA